MYRAVLLFLIGLFSLTNVTAQVSRVGSQPDAITIYTRGAVVKRSFSAGVHQGANDITVTGISNKVDESSIHIIAPSSIRIISVEYSAESAGGNMPWRYKLLADSLDTLKALYLHLENYKAALNEEILLLKENRKITPSQAGVFIDDLEEAADFYRSRVAEVFNRMDAADKKDEILKKQIKRLEQLLQLFPSGEIRIIAESDDNTTAGFGLTYKTGGVSWSPRYELFIDGNQQASLNYFARIHQMTGEDWSNAAITLNTGRLFFSDSLLNKPWFIGISNDNHFLNSPYSTINDLLPLSGVFNLLPDTLPAKVLIKKENLGFTVLNIARPEIASHPVSYVQIPAWQDHHFLSGEMTLYRGNEYLGSSQLTTSLLADTLTIRLGEDEDIEIGRAKMKDVSQKQFLSSSVKQTFGYAVSLKNNGSIEQIISLEEHIPVSQSKDIEVKTENTGHADYNPASGVLKWEVKLSPGQMETIQYSYSIKYPKGEDIKGIE